MVVDFVVILRIIECVHCGLDDTVGIMFHILQGLDMVNVIYFFAEEWLLYSLYVTLDIQSVHFQHAFYSWNKCGELLPVCRTCLFTIVAC